MTCEFCEKPATQRVEFRWADAPPRLVCADHAAQLQRAMISGLKQQLEATGMEWVPAPLEVRSDSKEIPAMNTPQNPFVPEAEAADVTIDDRFFSLRFLSYELENIAEQGEQGGERSDAAQMRAAMERVSQWRQKLDAWEAETRPALADVDALDQLLDGEGE